MAGEVNNIILPPYSGLTDSQVISLQERFGKNLVGHSAVARFFTRAYAMISDPMFMILFACAILYFILGESGEGILMLAAMLLVAGISIYQGSKAANALKALKAYTAATVSAIRNGQAVVIKTEELVPGDIIYLKEGEKIPADAIILSEYDLTVNESVITGESFPVQKSLESPWNSLYQGALINSGYCYAKVSATGPATLLGKTGLAIDRPKAPVTTFQKQLYRFLRRFTVFGIIAFFVICILNFIKTGSLAASLLTGLTLALAAIPEEIPVAFSSFLALGAFALSKRGIITRSPQTIENLGAVNVLCVDKTGTLTENNMEVKAWFDVATGTSPARTGEEKQDQAYPVPDVLKFARLASEQHPFDTMEKALHRCVDASPISLANWELVHEYPLEGRPPMMTHVYRYGHEIVAAAKGGLEKILSVCRLAQADQDNIVHQAEPLYAEGCRVIGVAAASHTGDAMPGAQEDFNWIFKGFIAFEDPVKKYSKAIISDLQKARIGVKLLTGDHPQTAQYVARSTGIAAPDKYITGEEVMGMNEQQLAAALKNTHVFARMFPEAKLKVIDNLKSTGNIVGMTGDGVNDGLALKSADIGIAMGAGGTDIARLAADLVLTDDNLASIVEAVSQGRKIFSNFKKGLRYIISIHIPIILTAILPILFNWKYPNIFTPLHIIFLELVMSATCSVFFEREPVEAGIMLRGPVSHTGRIFQLDELLLSIIQGLIITIGVLAIDFRFASDGYSLEETRTAVFTTLAICNVLLTFANRSFTQNIIQTMRFKNNMAFWIIILPIVALLIIHLLAPVRNMFGLAALSPSDWSWCIGASAISVGWFEIYKTHLQSLKAG